jgi:hypothetical protein
MHSLALIQAEHALRLAAERADEHDRRAELARSSGRSHQAGKGVGATISGLKRRLAFGPVDQPVTPVLSDYPYRA